MYNTFFITFLLILCVTGIGWNLDSKNNFLKEHNVKLLLSKFEEGKMEAQNSQFHW